MNAQKACGQTIGLYYGLSGLNRLAFNFMITTYAIFMMERGLNLQDLAWLNSMYFLTVIIMEVPTGAVADVFGRRSSFLLAAIIYSSSMFIYYGSHSIWGFGMAEIAAALGATLWSGSFQGWVVDRLKHYRYDKPTLPIFTRVTQVEILAGIVGSLGGAFFAKYYQQQVWLVSGVLFALGGVIAAFLMKEEYFVKGQLALGKVLNTYKSVVRNALSTSLKNREVRFLMILGVVIMLAEQAPTIYWQPFFKPYLPSKAWYGPLGSGMDVAVLIGAQIALYLVTLLKGEKRALIVGSLVMAAAIAICGLAHSLPLVIGLFMLGKVMRGTIRPLSDTILNREISSSERTTILSFANLTSNAGGWLGLIVMGYLAEKISIGYSWVVSGVFLAIAILWLARPARTAAKNCLPAPDL